MKSTLRRWLDEGRFDEIVNAVVSNRRLLGTLFTITYDTDPLVVGRAVDAFGRAADRLADVDPEFVREHLRRLFWLITDESGGIAWRAPETAGEVLRRRPDTFRDFVPLLLSVLDMEPEDLVRFLPGTLCAIGRLAEAAPQALSSDQAWWVRQRAVRALFSADSQARGLALWCLARLPGIDAEADARRFTGDTAPVTLYANGQIESTTVGGLAATCCRNEPAAGP